jgi:hypothetical protein
MLNFSSTEADATLSLGMSSSLKDRIDDAARTENVSVDAWALRVIEDALRPAPEKTDMADGSR